MLDVKERKKSLHNKYKHSFSYRWWLQICLIGTTVIPMKKARDFSLSSTQYHWLEWEKEYQVSSEQKLVGFLRIRKWRNSDCTFLTNPFSNQEKTNSRLRIAIWPIIHGSLLLKYWPKFTGKECDHKSNNFVFTLAYEYFTFVKFAHLTVTSS